MATPKRLGLIVNPIAGMGGKVALKGTDGAETLAAAYARGARPEAGDKALRALRSLLPMGGGVEILTASGEMGEAVCKKLNLPCRVLYRAGEPTAAADTLSAAAAICDAGAELLLFAGGDGTARNICEAVGERVPALGIPAGVKIQSAVFAVTPEAAGGAAAAALKGGRVAAVPREVVDLDEDAYRTGRVSAALYGTLLTPDQPDRLQCMKQGGFSTETEQLSGIARYLQERLEPEAVYAVGSGSTAKCLSRRLGLPYELLGVDVLQNGALLARDVTEEQLWAFARGGGLRVLVSPIGGQGFLFGRGNHQFSARVLRAVGKEGITVLSPESKLLSIRDHVLRVDCGDPEVSQALRGYYSVLCGYGYFLSLPCR